MNPLLPRYQEIHRLSGTAGTSIRGVIGRAVIIFGTMDEGTTEESNGTKSDDDNTTAAKNCHPANRTSGTMNYGTAGAE